MIFYLVNRTYVRATWNFPLCSGTQLIFASQIFANLKKIVHSINIHILPCKIGPMCHMVTNKKCDFVDLNSFLVSQIFATLQKLFILSIFKFCLVNWTYVPHGNKQKVRFWHFFRIFLCVLDLNSFFASQIFAKLRKIVHSINIHILNEI